MCGIVGIISKKGDNVVNLIDSMLTSIACRGPDGAGIAASSRIVLSDSIAGLGKGKKLSSDAALGHVRLEIVGGRSGQQPFRSCNGRFTLEHNGEIYNYKKLRDRLRKKHDFVTDTDSEVIVHMVEKSANVYKENCL
jgi:asparagine synthase (glutamine-hydrolysing)